MPLDRLDKCVTVALSSPFASRSAVSRWIVEGRVKLNDALAVSGKARVAPGSRIEVSVPAPPSTAALPDPSVAFRVLYEDEDLIVIDKPGHLVVHPAHGHETGTLVNGLIARGLDVDNLREEEAPSRPGIVHRLDKGTSGVMVVAKNPLAREGLKALFARHDIEREYLALVLGQAHDASFDTPHGRHPRDRMRFSAATRDPKAKRAITHFRLVEQLSPGLNLVTCTLETGRTHQIRVHLSEQMRTPILGDPLYGGVPKQSADLGMAARLLGRQALHARVLGFRHPRSGEAVRWETPPPADFQTIVVWARNRSTG